MLISDCKLDPDRLGVLAECLTGDPQQGEWPEQLLSARTIAYSCGILAKQQDVIAHAHDEQELALCKRLAGEAAQIMKGLYMGGSDEGDHTLDPFFIPVNQGDPVPKAINEQVLRSALHGTIHPKASLVFEPFTKSSKWWAAATKVDPALASDPDEKKRVGQWAKLFDWFSKHKELHAPVYVGFNESAAAPASVYPRFFLGLTSAGSLVGLATCVVWS